MKPERLLAACGQLRISLQRVGAVDFMKEPPERGKIFEELFDVEHEATSIVLGMELFHPEVVRDAIRVRAASRKLGLVIDMPRLRLAGTELPRELSVAVIDYQEALDLLRVSVASCSN